MKGRIRHGAALAAVLGALSVTAAHADATPTPTPHVLRCLAMILQPDGTAVPACPPLSPAVSPSPTPEPHAAVSAAVVAAPARVPIPSTGGAEQ